jgi:hypothetical protein
MFGSLRDVKDAKLKSKEYEYLLDVENYYLDPDKLETFPSNFLKTRRRRQAVRLSNPL